ncbi:MI domain-containing protein, partial [Haematococcus lacustris]
FHKDFASCQACVIEVIRKEPLPFSATDSLGVGGALRMHGPRMGLPPGMGPAGPGAMGGPSGGGGPQWGDRRQAGPMDPRFQDARGGRGGVTGPPGPGARGTVGTRGGGMDDKQWERRGPGAAGGMAAGGRGGPGGRGGGIGSLHRAESRFVIGAVRGDDPVEEKKQKEILATLNKVTPNTLEKLTDHGKEEGELPQPAVEAKPLTANQLLQQNRAARRRMLGNILFVGNLFKISLITER